MPKITRIVHCLGGDGQVSVVNSDVPLIDFPLGAEGDCVVPLCRRNIDLLQSDCALTRGRKILVCSDIDLATDSTTDDLIEAVRQIGRQDVAYGGLRQISTDEAALLLAAVCASHAVQQKEPIVIVAIPCREGDFLKAANSVGWPLLEWLSAGLLPHTALLSMGHVIDPRRFIHPDCTSYTDKWNLHIYDAFSIANPIPDLDDDGKHGGMLFDPPEPGTSTQVVEGCDFSEVSPTHVQIAEFLRLTWLDRLDGGKRFNPYDFFSEENTRMYIQCLQELSDA